MSENIIAKLNEEPKTIWVRLVTVAIVVSLMTWGSQSLHFSGFTDSGLNVAKGLVNGLLHPNVSLIFDMSDSGIPFLLLQTIAIAVLGTIIGAILAIPVSFLASTNIVPKPVAMFFRALILLIRTIPALIWALVWIRVTGPGPFCGVVTQSVCSIGMIPRCISQPSKI